MYIFISHSSKDASIAEELCNLIEANGFECFIAPRNIRSGYEYASELINGIDRSDAILLLLSENANSSPHILREIERAVSKSIPIIVYKLEEVTLSKSLEYFLMTHQWLNAENGNHEILLKCINDLRNNTSTAIEASTVNITTTNTQINITKNSEAKTFINKNQKNKDKKNPIFIGILAIVVVITICLTLAFSKKVNDKKDDNSTTIDNQNTLNTNTSNNNTQNNSTNNNSSVSPDNTLTAADTDIQLGDSVVFGKYNDADIYWNVIKISEDRTEAVLLAKNILTFKAFNGAESGKCGWDENKLYMSSDSELKNNLSLQAHIYGNSSWETSDIRTWLNSDKENVKYEGYGPISSSMCGLKNSYNLEAGFLYNFSDDELSAIKETTIKTKGNALSKDDIITTIDRVFLLSTEEIKWLKEADVALFTSPTDEAIAKNESLYYSTYSLDIYCTSASAWWLREPVDGSATKCYMVSYGVNPDEDFLNTTVSAEDFGIRPAITVDLSSDCIKIVNN